MAPPLCGSAPDPEPEAVIDVAATLMATPFGFRWIATGEAFAAWLLAVDEINIARWLVHTKLFPEPYACTRSGCSATVERLHPRPMTRWP